MPVQQQNNAWQRFLDRPPELVGGVALDVVPLDSRRVRLRLSHGRASVELLAAWLAVPYPSGLRRLLAAEPDLEAVVVERAPRGFDAAALEEDISYLDIRGRGRVVGPGFVYVVSPLPGPPADLGAGDLPGAPEQLPRAPRSPGVSRGVQSPGRLRKPRVSPFAPKASRIVRALLARPDARWRLSSLAEEVEVDPGNAHRVLGALVDSGLVERDEDLYFVADPGSLLEAWAERARRPSERLQVQVPHDLHAAVEEVAAAALDYIVISGELAAEELAPYVPSKSAVIHCMSPDGFAAVESRVEEWPKSLRSAGRIQIDLADEGVRQFGSERDGLHLASPAQIYVDLAREPGRAREAAEHLRREVLGY